MNDRGMLTRAWPLTIGVLSVLMYFSTANRSHLFFWLLPEVPMSFVDRLAVARKGPGSFSWPDAGISASEGLGAALLFVVLAIFLKIRKATRPLVAILPIVVSLGISAYTLWIERWGFSDYRLDRRGTMVNLSIETAGTLLAGLVWYVAFRRRRDLAYFVSIWVGIFILVTVAGQGVDIAAL